MPNKTTLDSDHLLPQKLLINTGVDDAINALQVNGGTKTNKLTVAAPVVPATAAAAGLKGEIAYDASYVYVCVAVNTWKRSPLTTW